MYNIEPTLCHKLLGAEKVRGFSSGQSWNIMINRSIDRMTGHSRHFPFSRHALISEASFLTPSYSVLSLLPLLLSTMSLGSQSATMPLGSQQKYGSFLFAEKRVSAQEVNESKTSRNSPLSVQSKMRHNRKQSRCVHLVFIVLQ